MLSPYALIVWLIGRRHRRKRQSNMTEEKKPVPRWEHVTAYLGGKFKEIKLDRYRAVYCYDYHPSGKFDEEHLPVKDLDRRAEILRFKDGEYGPMAELLTDFIRGNFWKQSLPGWVLCAIPASTREKHVTRYARLMEEVSEATGIRNGFECIRIKFDRKDSREKKEANTVRNLEFDRAGIRGKWVLVLDDITTRGTSFVQCAEKLYANGAEYVCGFFMGKTVDW